MKAILTRQQYSDKQVLGEMVLWDGDKEIYRCKTLELPWKNNQNRVSCIPTGTYKTSLRTFGNWANESFHVTTPEGEEVPGRHSILIHKGNFYTDILGCILVGKEHADLELKTSTRHIKKDGLLDVTSSGATVKELLAITDGFELEIVGDQPDISTVPVAGTDAPEEHEVFSPLKAADKALVTASYLNVRESPNGKKLEFGLTHSTLVEVLEVAGGWLKVAVLPCEGWVSAKFVKSSGSLGIIDTESGFLNIRKEPNGEKVKDPGLYKGTHIDLLEEKDGWLKVKVTETQGYVYGEFLTKFVD